jgi:hypothetical protein
MKCCRKLIARQSGGVQKHFISDGLSLRLTLDPNDCLLLDDKGALQKATLLLSITVKANLKFHRISRDFADFALCYSALRLFCLEAVS